MNHSNTIDLRVDVRQNCGYLELLGVGVLNKGGVTIIMEARPGNRGYGVETVNLRPHHPYTLFRVQRSVTDGALMVTSARIDADGIAGTPVPLSIWQFLTGLKLRDGTVRMIDRMFGTSLILMIDDDRNRADAYYDGLPVPPSRRPAVNQGKTMREQLSRPLGNMPAIRHNQPARPEQRQPRRGEFNALRQMPRFVR